MVASAQFTITAVYDGEDALTLKITSSAGVLSRNRNAETVLTAHVYRGKRELSLAEIEELGEILWFKDEGTLCVGRGATINATAATVAQYRAKLVNFAEAQTGNVISFTDEAGETTIQNLVVEIEPYQAGSGDPSQENNRPIHGWDEVKLTRAGRNLVQWTRTADYHYQDVTWHLDKETGTISLSGTAAANATVESFVNKIPVPRGTDLIYSGSPEGASTSTYRARIRPWSPDMVGQPYLYANTTAEYTVEVNADTQYISWSAYIYKNVTADNLTYRPYIRLADEENDEWELPSAETTEVSLGRTVHGGYLDFTSGKLVVTKKSITYSSVAARVATRYSGKYRYSLGRPANAVVPPNNTTVTDILCDSLKPVMNYGGANTGLGTYELEEGINFHYSNGAAYVYLDALSEATLDEARAYFAEHPFTVVYTLKEPEVYQLDAHQIDTLLGKNNVWADCGPVTMNWPEEVIAIDEASLASVYDGNKLQEEITAKKAIAAGSIIVGDESGYEMAAAGVTFDLAYPVLYMPEAMAAGGVNEAGYTSEKKANLRTNVAGWTGTAGKRCYLVGTLGNDNQFTIDSTVFTTTVPTVTDGKIYISIGVLYAPYYLYFMSSKDLYTCTVNGWGRFDKGYIETEVGALAHTMSQQMIAKADLTNELGLTYDPNTGQYYEYDSVQGQVITTIVAKILARASEIVESYDFSEQVSIKSIREDLEDGIKTLQADIKTTTDIIQGQIRRGFVTDPTGVTHLGIVISSREVFKKEVSSEGEVVLSEPQRGSVLDPTGSPNDNSYYYQIDTGQCFGLYTAMGWEFWKGNKRLGWFSTEDEHLHVDHISIETSFVQGDWLFDNRNGFGIRYIGG